MSIRDRQVQQAERDALMQELRAGRYPDLATVQTMITQAFQTIPAGMPRFSLTPLVNDEISDPDSLNQTLKGMTQDIQTGFDEVADLQNQMMALADYYDTEKGRINRSLINLDHRIQSLNDKIGVPQSLHIWTQHFYDFLQIDFTGNTGRNIPATDVLVDLDKGRACLDHIKQAFVRYDISNAQIEALVSANAVTTNTLSPLDAILNDAINSAWRYEVDTNDNAPVTVTIHVTLDSPVNATSISIVSESPAATDITLHTSTDGITFDKQETKTTTSMASWLIPMAAVAEMKFDLVKREPDSTDRATRQFFFGVNRVMVQKDLYQTSGKLVSRPFPIQDFVIDQVQLAPTDTVLPGTGIRYYIGIDDGKNKVEWAEADNNGVVSYPNYENFDGFIDDTSPFYGTPVDTVNDAFGNQNYALIDLLKMIKNVPNPGATQVYLGHRMWKIDTLKRPVATGTTPLTTTGPQDWTTAAGLYTTQYIGIENSIDGKTIGLAAGTYNRLTIQFYYEQEGSPYIQKLALDPNTVIAAYLNNESVYNTVRPDGIQYTYNFKAGLNTLVFYLATPPGTTGFVAPNLALTDTVWTRAQAESLDEVSLSTLYHNVSIMDHSKFAFKDGTVVVNYDPKALDALGYGVRYEILCRYPLIAPQNVGVRLMAIFSRSQGVSGQSAQLSKYQLVVK